MNEEATAVTETDEMVSAIEKPEHATSEIVSSMGDDVFMAQLEKAAINAPKIEAAMQKMMVAATHAGDWKRFGDKACLSSAGAERLLKHFPITYANWSCRKEPFQDTNGNGYRYIYSCTASMWGRTIQAEGRYGTRDRFLGYANSEWRDVSDINENFIQSAAYHICRGEAIKAFLGLRDMEWSVLSGILGGQAKNANGAGEVQFNQGANGGVSTEDRKLQGDLGKMIKEMHGDNLEDMKEYLIAITSFEGRDGKTVSCDSIKKLKGKWLRNTVKETQHDHTVWQKKMDDKREPGEEG